LFLGKQKGKRSSRNGFGLSDKQRKSGNRFRRHTLSIGSR
jgi:hypothetical protein